MLGRALIALCLSSLGATTSPSRAEPVSDDAGTPPRTWRVGLVAPMTGPIADLGLQVRRGIVAYFDEVNARGGVFGRQLELLVRDDGYEPSRTAPAVRELIDREHVFALLGNVGTPTAAVTVPIANEKRIPLFAPLTGAGLLRKSPPDRYVINLRASYAQELAAIVSGLVDDMHLDVSQIGLFTQRDAYGDAGFNAALEAMKAHGLVDTALVAHGRYVRNTLDVEDGLSRLIDPSRDIKAVIMVGAYAPCARFITLARGFDFEPLFINLSFVGSESLAARLGEHADGVVVSQVVPLPDGATLAARAFQARVPPPERTFITFEGYLAAEAFVVALSRAGPDATSESLVDAAESGAQFDLGLAQPLSLSPSQHQLSHAVWPTVIRAGRFVALERWSDLVQGGRRP